MVEFSINKRSPVTCKSFGQGANVTTLIDTDTRWWNISLVEEIFNVEAKKNLWNGHLPKFTSRSISLGRKQKWNFHCQKHKHVPFGEGANQYGRRS